MKKSDQIDAVYRALPNIQCKGLCTQSCGPIPMSAAERERLAGLGVALTYDDNLTCSALKDGRCSIYALRPLVCRLYGVEKRLRCPHGCVPERWISDAESYAALKRLDRIKAGGVSGRDATMTIAEDIAARLQAKGSKLGD